MAAGLREQQWGGERRAEKGVVHNSLKGVKDKRQRFRRALHRTRLRPSAVLRRWTPPFLAEFGHLIVPRISRRRFDKGTK